MKRVKKNSRVHEDQINSISSDRYTLMLKKPQSPKKSSKILKSKGRLKEPELKSRGSQNNRGGSYYTSKQHALQPSKPNPKTIHNLYKSLRPETFKREKMVLSKAKISASKEGVMGKGSLEQTPKNRIEMEVSSNPRQSFFEEGISCFASKNRSIDAQSEVLFSINRRTGEAEDKEPSLRELFNDVKSTLQLKNDKIRFLEQENRGLKERLAELEEILEKVLEDEL